MAAIKKRNLEGLSTEDQYKGELLAQELKFLSSKMKIYKKGSKEYEQAYTESLGKQVDADKVVKDLLEKAEKELANAKLENLKEGIQKLKVAEENRWADELAGLKKQLLDKMDLKEQEVALNDTINKTIKEKTTAHLKIMGDLIKALADFLELVRHFQAQVTDQASLAAVIIFESGNEKFEALFYTFQRRKRLIIENGVEMFTDVRDIFVDNLQAKIFFTGEKVIK
jgi:hypothetical protein